MQIHTKKRNRLAQKRLNDLVFVKYNRALKRRYLKRDRIDPISLKDIDESNEWLVGKMEEECVFEGDDLNWDDVALASGAEEPSKTTRASSSKSTDSTPIAKMAKPTPKAKASRGKTSLIDEENEEGEWETDDEEEEDMEGYKSKSSSDDDEIQDEVLGSENDD
jgi:hypothetical protein